MNSHFITSVYVAVIFGNIFILAEWKIVFLRYRIEVDNHLLLAILGHLKAIFYFQLKKKYITHMHIHLFIYCFWSILSDQIQ